MLWLFPPPQKPQDFSQANVIKLPPSNEIWMIIKVPWVPLPRKMATLFWSTPVTFCWNIWNIWGSCLSQFDKEHLQYHHRHHHHPFQITPPVKVHNSCPAFTAKCKAPRCFWSRARCTGSLGIPVTVTTRIMTFLVGNPYKPCFSTIFYYVYMTIIQIESNRYIISMYLGSIHCTY